MAAPPTGGSVDAQPVRPRRAKQTATADNSRRARPHRVRTRPAQDLGAAISFVSITAGSFLIARPAAGSASATINSTVDDLMTMNPEEHTAAIRTLQTDISEIKGIVNNGLRTMVQDQKSELATVKEDIQQIRDALTSHVAKEDVIYEIFKRVMNTGVTITGALIALLLSIIGYLLVKPVGLH
jgi:hypothetical protein